MAIAQFILNCQLSVVSQSKDIKECKTPETFIYALSRLVVIVCKLHKSLEIAEIVNRHATAEQGDRLLGGEVHIETLRQVGTTSGVNTIAFLEINL